MKYLFSGALLLMMLSLVYADDIYQYQDKNGAMVFTNKPVKNGKKVNLPPISVYAAPMTQRDYNSSGLTDKPGNPVASPGLAKIYVKNSSPSFGTNEVGRQQILNEELASEKQALTDSQQALTAGKATTLPSEQNNPVKYQTRIQALQDAVTEHQKNITILSKQLGSNDK
jgi:hypothetical protein